MTNPDGLRAFTAAAVREQIPDLRDPVIITRMLVAFADLLETCELCGEPMPTGEEMFKFHGYSGPCPKPPLKPDAPEYYALLKAAPFHVAGDRSVMNTDGHRLASADSAPEAALIRDALNALAGTPAPWQPESASPMEVSMTDAPIHEPEATYEQRQEARFAGIGYIGACGR